MRRRDLILVALFSLSIPFRVAAQEVVFSPSVNVSNTPTLSQSARIAIDGAGTIYILWEESGSAILFSRSADGGDTFTSPQLALPTDPDISPGQLALASTTPAIIHISLTLFDTFLGGAEIAYQRSTNKGDTFSTPLLVSPVDGVNYVVSSIATDGARAVGTAWQGSDLATGQSSVSYSRSVDNGDSFSQPAILADSHLLGVPVFCPAIQMVGSQNVYIAWLQGPFGQEDIFFSRSVDGGLSFSSPINISNLPEKGWCPKMAVDGTGNLYVAWEKGAAFVDRRTFFSRSTDGGLSFSVPIILSNQISDSTCSAISATGRGAVYVTYSSSSTLDTSLVLSFDGGITFTAPLSVPEAKCPQIATRSPTEIGLTWNQPPSDGAQPDIFYMRGLVTSGGRRAHADFTGDGKSDILWRNTVTGDVAIWLMNGFTLLDSRIIATVSINSDWVIAGIGDFNGDGRADILWRNAVTGDVAIWLMNGFTLLDSRIVATINPAWSIVGVGDFNGDGKADILWRNATTGDTAMFLMDGLTLLNSALIGNINPAWLVVGVGDFNGDGKDDILWRRSSTGDNAIFLMNGFTTMSSALIPPVPANWLVVGVGDFNGDGKDDILWRDPSTGNNAIFLMNGFTLTSSAVMAPVLTNWKVGGVGDFDGDGKADILWRDPSTGNNAIFLMNGFTLTNSALILSVPTGWSCAGEIVCQ